MDLTQEALANLVGVTRQTIISIEAGKYVPSTVLAMKITKIFERPMETIFELKEETNNG